MSAKCFRCDKPAICVTAFSDPFRRFWYVRIEHIDGSKPCISECSYTDIAESLEKPDNSYVALAQKYSDLVAALGSK